ncbi:serine hydrolase domain-containing protein [Sphingopyxis sp.]|uniref:serine hydrolase domain-containing protein n=1 Tax=Sphingopyxis sp. TaxID=1908224 RepID=UPI0035AEC58C
MGPDPNNADDEYDHYIAAEQYSKNHKGDYLLVMKDGGLVFKGVPGNTDPDSKEYPSENFVHTLNSGTKSFSCALQAFAVNDQGHSFDMDLNRKVANKVTDWTSNTDNDANVTLRDLLMLQSGLAGNSSYNPNEVSTADTYNLAVNEISPTDRSNANFIYDPLSFQNFALYFQIALGSSGAYAGNGKLHINLQGPNPVEYLDQKLFSKFGLTLIPDNVIDDPASDHDGNGYPDAYENIPDAYAWGQDGALDADSLPSDPNPIANPHDQMAGGAALTASAWIKYGQFLLQQGTWNGERLLPASSLNNCVNGALTPSTSDDTLNPVFGGYGISFWLNADLVDPVTHISTYQRPDDYDETGESGDILPPVVAADLCDDRTQLWPSAPLDAFAAAGGLFQRLYVIPSKNLVVVRFGAVPKVSSEAPDLPVCPTRTPPSQFDDDEFLQALLGT